MRGLPCGRTTAVPAVSIATGATGVLRNSSNTGLVARGVPPSTHSYGSTHGLSRSPGTLKAIERDPLGAQGEEDAFTDAAATQATDAIVRATGCLAAAFETEQQSEISRVEAAQTWTAEIVLNASGLEAATFRVTGTTYATARPSTRVRSVRYFTRRLCLRKSIATPLNPARI